MTELKASPALVDLPPDAKVDRLGFVWLRSKGHLLFVPELAPPPGEVAMEIVKAAMRLKEKSR